jgi:endonuclease/exonuclease/phosphatase family metal-dependent hydrolase
VVWRNDGVMRCAKTETDTEGRGIAARMSVDGGGSFLVIGIYGVAAPDSDVGKSLQADMLTAWVAENITKYQSSVGAQARVIVAGDFNGVENPGRDRAPLPSGPRRGKANLGDARVVRLLRQTGLRDVAELHNDTSGTAFNMTFMNIPNKNGYRSKSRIDRMYVTGGGFKKWWKTAGDQIGKSGSRPQHTVSRGSCLRGDSKRPQRCHPRL